MNNIEDDLKRALRRQEPPADFAGKIMSRVVSGQNLEPQPLPGPSKVLGFGLKPKLMVWLASAAAAACLVGLFVTRSYQVDRPGIPISGPGPESASRTDPSAVQPQSKDNQAPTPRARQDDSIFKSQVAESQRGRRIQHLKGNSYHPFASRPTSDEARFAEEQLKLALAITSAKLVYAQRSIQEADGTNTTDREINP